jgi:hypothetical protein
MGNQRLKKVIEGQRKEIANREEQLVILGADGRRKIQQKFWTLKVKQKPLVKKPLQKPLLT